jgi:pimeloyl-ACP methyl ester carboxylesterase
MIQPHWLRRPNNDLSVVFIHGFNSSEGCWKAAEGESWPDLVLAEGHLSTVGVYSFNYRTGIGSGYYNLGDVVDSLKEYMQLDGVLGHSKVIFVCHSMGGIVARRYLVSQQGRLIEGGLREVGLFLVASPSLGSQYATMLETLTRLAGHTQGEALRFSQANVWLNDLDKDFMNLKESGKLRIKGKELIEDQPIVLKRFLFFKRQIVEPFSGNRYFGDPYKVPASDHFTIARPKATEAIQHRLLCQFIALVRGTKANGSEPIVLTEASLKLRDAMVKIFDATRLELLCLDLGVGYDMLQGKPIEVQISILIAACEAQGGTAGLLDKITSQYPGIRRYLQT